MICRPPNTVWRFLVVGLMFGCTREPVKVPTGKLDSNSTEVTPLDSIEFGDSIAAAFDEAKQKDRRVLVYFSGPSCLWCRVMEQKTHADSAIIDLASRFVCVKVDVNKSPGIREDYGVFSIPRTIVLTPDNKRITDCIGFEPPAQHKTRLQAAINADPLPPVKRGSNESRVVGASADTADIVFWFINRSEDTAADSAQANDHSELLSYLRDRGFKPRIEDMPRPDFKARWAESNTSQRPDFLVAHNRSGLLQQLMQGGVTCDVISTRLRLESIPAVCTDFTLRHTWLVIGSRNQQRAEQAIQSLFEAPSGSMAGVTRFTRPTNEQQARDFAQQAAMRFVGGKVQELQHHWDTRAPQYGMPESDETRWANNLKVHSDGVQLVGNDQFAIALIETRATGANADRPWFISASTTIGSPTLVILKRDEANVWRILAAGILGYDVNVDKPARLLQFQWQDARSSDLAKPAILGPQDGVLPPSGTCQWDVSDSNRDHLNLLVKAHFGADGSRGAIVMTCLPKGVVSGMSPINITSRVTAQIWTISPSGAIGVSELREWKPEARRLPKAK